MVNYIGPSRLKKLAVSEYRRVDRQHYERRDEPTIAAGFPVPFLVDFAYRLYNFSSQSKYHAFIDNNVKEISKKLNTARKARTQRKKRTLAEECKARMRSLINEAGFDSGILKEAGEKTSHRIGAGYSITLDVIFIDPTRLALQSFGMDDHYINQLTSSSSTQISLPHELVHFDIGECIPYVESRTRHLSMQDILRRHEKALQKGEVPPEAGECDRLEKEVNDILERMEDLRIPAIDEAIAYNYSEDRGRFERWLRSCGMGDHDELMQLYDAIACMIKQTSRITVLKQVKSAINESWKTGRNAVKLFLN